MNPKPACLIAALTPSEVQDFFPEPLWTEVRPIATEFRLIDPTELSPGEFHAALRAYDPEVLLACWKTPALPMILSPRLRYVCYLTGSVRRIVSAAHLTQGLLLSNWGDSISRVVAEGALLHVLACLRRATAWSIGMHLRGAWKEKDSETASLFGRKVGLHGFGPVARELVKLMRPFGVEIGVVAPDVSPEIEREWKVGRFASLEALFAESDVVVEAAPLNRETLNVVKETHLRLLRPGSVFVNVGRADVVDEEALVRVAGEIEIGHVADQRDVFE
jgi:phosphoglycerate dehydrogenase-like enzyme